MIRELASPVHYSRRSVFLRIEIPVLVSVSHCLVRWGKRRGETAGSGGCARRCASGWRALRRVGTWASTRGEPLTTPSVARSRRKWKGWFPDAGTPDCISSLLQAVALSAASTSLPFSSHLLGIHHAGHRETWFHQRALAGNQAHQPLPSISGGRLRPCSLGRFDIQNESIQ